jgi:hypothetical protein
VQGRPGAGFGASAELRTYGELRAHTRSVGDQDDAGEEQAADPLFDLQPQGEFAGSAMITTIAASMTAETIRSRRYAPRDPPAVRVASVSTLRAR